MSRWIRENLGADTPLHFSRFFPLYKMTAVPPTPVPTLDRARAIAQKAGLRYVYVGNVPGHSANSTYCPKCLRVVLKRAGFSVVEANITGGRCGACGEKIAGVGLSAGGTKI
jgi:pyruvate formate lyase activating enzyme